MRQPKQKRGLVRRVTILLAAMAAGSLPMLAPQWMTQLAAAVYGYGVYDDDAQTLSFSEIVIPLLDSIMGEETGEADVFKFSLTRHPGGLVFEAVPWTVEWVKDTPATDTFPVTYDYTTRTINIPCVKVNIWNQELWLYKDAILEQVNMNDPVFEVSQISDNDGTCPQ